MKTKISAVVVSLSLGFLAVKLDADPLPVVHLNSSGNWENSAIWTPATVPGLADQIEATHSVEISGIGGTGTTTVLLEGVYEGAGADREYTNSTYRIGNLHFDDTLITVFRNTPGVGAGAGKSNNVTMEVTGNLTKQGTGTLRFLNNTSGSIVLVVNGDLEVSGGRMDVGATNAGAGGIGLSVGGSTRVTDSGILSLRMGRRLPVSDPLQLGGVEVSDGGILQLYAGSNGAAAAQNYGFNSLNGDGVIQLANSTGTLFTGNIWLTTSGNDHFSGVLREVAQDGQTTVNASLSLHMTGTGSVTLSGANTYQGGTEIQNGTVIADHDSALGTGAVAIKQQGTLVVNTGRTVNQEVTVNEGSLIVHGTLAGNQTSVTLSGSARVGGSGNIGTAIALNSTSHILSPGSSTGILTFTESQQWTALSYEWQVDEWTDQSADAGNHYDQILIEGQLNLTGATDIDLMIQSLQLDGGSGQLSGFSETSRSWVILSATGGVVGFDESVWSIHTTDFQNAYQGQWSVDLSGSDIVLNYTAIPEPGTAVLLLLSTFGLGAILRKRRIHG